MNKLLLTLALIVLCGSGAGIACRRHDLPSRAHLVGERIAVHLELYANQNAGSLPTNWIQVSTLSEDLKPHGNKSSVPEMFFLLKSNLTFSRGYQGEGEMVAIQTHPEYEQGVKGRFFVMRNNSNEFHADWMSEAGIQEFFSEHHEKVPDMTK
jgi:hypothetical protein